jgi:hypothetical protein
MNNRTQIPRWMVQQTSSIGEAASNKIRVVTPEDLQTASQMYGALSQSMSQVAYTNFIGLQHHRPDISAMKSYDTYLTATKALQQLRIDPEASNSGIDYSKKAEPIIKDAIKDMDYFERNIMSNILQGEKFNTAVHIDKNMVDSEIATSMKFRYEEWGNKKLKYLSLVDSGWSQDQRKEFMQEVYNDQRKTLHFISDGQHKLFDEDFAKDYEAASVMNDVIRYEKFKKVKDRNDWLASGKLEEVFSNPDIKKRADKILKDSLELHNSKESFSSMMSQYAIQSIYNNFREKFDNEPNEIKKRELWRQELQSSNDYDPKYKRMLKQLGDIPGWNSRSTGYKSSSLSKDDWKRKGANSEYSPDEAMSLFQNNKITSEQYMSYQTGYRYRKKEYEALDNNFNNLIKSEFGISMKPP